MLVIGAEHPNCLKFKQILITKKTIMEQKQENYDFHTTTFKVLALLEGATMGEAEQTLNYVRQQLLNHAKVGNVPFPKYLKPKTNNDGK